MAINPYTASTDELEEAIGQTTPVKVSPDVVEQFLALVGRPPACLALNVENGGVLRITNTILHAVGDLPRLDGVACQTQTDADRRQASMNVYKTCPPRFPTAYQWVSELCLLIGLMCRFSAMGRTGVLNLVAAQHVFASKVTRALYTSPTPHGMCIKNVATASTGTHNVDVFAARAANPTTIKANRRRFSATMTVEDGGPNSTQFASGTRITVGPAPPDEMVKRNREMEDLHSPYQVGINHSNLAVMQRRNALTVVLSGFELSAWPDKMRANDIAAREAAAKAKRVLIMDLPHAALPILQPHVGYDDVRDVTPDVIRLPEMSKDAREQLEILDDSRSMGLIHSFPTPPKKRVPASKLKAKPTKRRRRRGIE